MAGRVHQINVSGGGVPKLPVDEAQITFSGVSGDRQADLRYHGGPDQKVCLYSLEVIEGLRAEGHPIDPGSAGENLTLSGFDWTRVTPGAQLRIGQALIEVTYPAVPCAKNARWFKDGKFSRILESRHPGWSRMYGRVLEEGHVAVGDPAALVTDPR
ncbi:MOSC domain-containing protein [soil metagenome]